MALLTKFWSTKMNVGVIMWAESAKQPKLYLPKQTKATISLS